MPSMPRAGSGGGLALEAWIMRHPALRRSARHSKRDSRPAGSQDGPPVSHDPAAQNRVAPGAPPDGEHNQGGARQEGLDYQRDLGSEQDA
jgi:hypothetical protein